MELQSNQAQETIQMRTLLIATVMTCIAATAHANGQKHFDRGLAASEDGNHIAAIESYTDAIFSDDLSGSLLSKTYNNRGLAQYRNGNHHAAFRALDRDQNAMRDFEAALKYDPAYTRAMHNRGKLLQELGRNRDAIEQYNELLLRDPDQAFGYKNRGKALRAAGRIDEALTDFDKVVELRPDYAYGYYYRGLTFLDLGLDSAARADIVAASDLRPGSKMIRRVAKRIGLN